jgi:general secretion pathway protein J
MTETGRAAPGTPRCGDRGKQGSREPRVRFRVSGISGLRSRVSSSRSAGFTLLELVISITIIGIIVLIIAGATRLGFRSVDAGEKKIESLERIRSSFSIISSQVQSEIPLVHDEDGSRKYYFKGGRDSLEFPTNYSLSGAERGYIIASYRVVPDARGKQVLYLTENGIGMENKIDTKLVDVYDEIYFEYFYKDPAAETGTWILQWTEDTILPEKIRVHFVEGTKDLALIIPMRSRGTLAQTSVPSQATFAPQGISSPKTKGQK